MLCYVIMLCKQKIKIQLLQCGYFLVSLLFWLALSGVTAVLISFTLLLYQGPIYTRV